MKKKRDFKTIYTAVFFAMCAVPAVFLPVSAALSSDADLAETPALVRDGAVNTDFSDECENWITDRVPLRSVVISAADFVKTGIFKTDSANVVAGKKGWLFLGDSVADYMNTNALSDERLRSIAVTLSLLEERTDENGGNFAFVPVPDKASVYSEFMPDRYKKADENNLTRLQSILKEENVSFSDMLELMTQKKSFGLYHKRDTHWNNYGALLGYYDITRVLNKDHKLYNDTDYIPKKNWRGDLDRMVYPFIGFRDYQYNLGITYDPYEFTVPAGVSDTQAQLESFMGDSEENDTRIATRRTENLGNGSLYMVRDSFGRALLPFFIDNYDTALFVRSDYADMSEVSEGTDMIYEVAERNIPDLFRTAPLMTAPVRAKADKGEASGEVIDYFWEQTENSTKIYGELRKEMLSDDGRVYVKLSNRDTEVIYEAFPVYEAGLLEGDGEYGFSLIADEKVLTAGQYDVEVISGGKAYSALSETPVSFDEERIANAKLSEGEEPEEEEEEEQEETPAPAVKWIEGLLADRAAVVYNGVVFTVGDNIGDIAEKLGEQSAPSSTAQSCLTDNEINEYYFAGLTIQTTEDGMIYSVEISENIFPGTKARTVGGIGCGSSYEDVETAFGDYYYEEGEYSIVYEEYQIKVQVVIRDEKTDVVLITVPEDYEKPVSENDDSEEAEGSEETEDSEAADTEE